eukprot:PRCOL_00005129-RA
MVVVFTYRVGTTKRIARVRAAAAATCGYRPWAQACAAAAAAGGASAMNMAPSCGSSGTLKRSAIALSTASFTPSPTSAASSSLPVKVTDRPSVAGAPGRTGASARSALPRSRPASHEHERGERQHREVHKPTTAVVSLALAREQPQPASHEPLRQRRTRLRARRMRVDDLEHGPLRYALEEGLLWPHGPRGERGPRLEHPVLEPPEARVARGILQRPPVLLAPVQLARQQRVPLSAERGLRAHVRPARARPRRRQE